MDHFVFARDKIERIVDATTIFVTASQNIGAPSPEKRSVGVFFLVCCTLHFSDRSTHRRSPSSPKPSSRIGTPSPSASWSWSASSTRLSTTRGCHRGKGPGSARRLKPTSRRSIQCASSCEFLVFFLHSFIISTNPKFQQFRARPQAPDLGNQHQRPDQRGPVHQRSALLDPDDSGRREQAGKDHCDQLLRPRQHLQRHHRGGG